MGLLTLGLFVKENDIFDDQHSDEDEDRYGAIDQQFQVEEVLDEEDDSMDDGEKRVCKRICQHKCQQSK